MGSNGSQPKQETIRDFVYRPHVLKIRNLSRCVLLRLFVFQGPTVPSSMQQVFVPDSLRSTGEHWVGTFFKGVNEDFVERVKRQFPASPSDHVSGLSTVSRERKETNSSATLEASSAASGRSGNMYVFIVMFYNLSDSPDKCVISSEALPNDGLRQLGESWRVLSSFHGVHQSLRHLQGPDLEKVCVFVELMQNMVDDHLEHDDSSQSKQSTSKVANKSPSSLSGNSVDPDSADLTASSDSKILASSDAIDDMSLMNPSSMTAGAPASMDTARVKSAKRSIVVHLQVFEIRGGCGCERLICQPDTIDNKPMTMCCCTFVSLHSLFSAIRRLEGVDEPPLPDVNKRDKGYIAYFWCRSSGSGNHHDCSPSSTKKFDNLDRVVYAGQFQSTASLLLEVLNSFPVSNESDHRLLNEMFRNVNGGSRKPEAATNASAMEVSMVPSLCPHLQQYKMFVQVRVYFMDDDKSSSSGLVMNQHDGTFHLQFKGVTSRVAQDVHRSLVKSMTDQRNSVILLNDSLSGQYWELGQQRDGHVQVSLCCFRLTSLDPTAYSPPCELKLGKQRADFGWDMIPSDEVVKSFLQGIDSERSQKAFIALNGVLGRTGKHN